MEQSKIKIFSKLLYLSHLSNKNGLDTDKTDDEKFEFVPCVIIFKDFQYKIDVKKIEFVPCVIIFKDFQCKTS